MQVKIHLKNLKADAIIGLYDRERTKRQPLIVDACLEYSVDDAVLSDCITDTIDYAEVSQSILEFIQSTHYVLLESFTVQLAQSLSQKYSLTSIHLWVQKPHALRSIGDVTCEYFHKP